MFFATLSRQPRKPTTPPVQWEVGTYIGGKAVGVGLTTRLHLVPSLRMSRFVLPLSLYALMPCSKTTLPLSVLYQNINYVWSP